MFALRPLASLLLVLLLAAGCVQTPERTTAPAPTAAVPLLPPISVTATRDTIEVAFPPAANGRAVRLVALPAHTGARQASDNVEVLWRGIATDSAARLARFSDAGHDRTLLRFALLDDVSAVPLGAPQWITRVNDPAAGRFDFLRPATKKGLSCMVDVDDARALGIGHVTQNISLGQLLLPGARNPEHFEIIDGVKIGLNPRAVANLDRYILAATRAGMNVYGILINPLADLRDAARAPLRHPRTKLDAPGATLGAFNVVTADGVRHFRAAIQFLMRRYTRPDAAHGWLSSLVMGNEINSHFAWHNQGDALSSDVLDDYAVAVRLAWLTAQAFHRDVRVYISLEHHWTIMGSDPSPLRALPAREFLEQFATDANASGDFPWHVAFHPYPEDLYQPAFWRDRLASRSADAVKISFRNLEVLTHALQQPELLHRGQPRRVALTEQGFHCRNAPDGEAEQAAAYSLAHYKVARMPQIEAFLYHRHVDHPGEGGLRLGLRETRSPAHDRAPGRARQIWETVRTADTPERERAHAFALRVAGLTRWEDAAPAVILDEPRAATDRNVVIDFVRELRTARSDSVLAFRPAAIPRAGNAANGALLGLLQHPPARGVGTAVWRVTLPALAPAQRLALEFGTAFASDQSVDGVEFIVRVDGTEFHRARQRDAQPVLHRIDLSGFAGRTVAVAFAVDPLANSAYDQAVWTEPQIRVVPGP